METINIGEEIEKVVKARKLSSAYIASKLGKTRSNMNHIYKRKTIDTELLYKICVVLDFNFFDFYGDSLRKKMGMERGVASKTYATDKLVKTIEAHEKNAATQNKYIELLEEKINSLQKEPEKKPTKRR